MPSRSQTSETVRPLRCKRLRRVCQRWQVAGPGARRLRTTTDRNEPLCRLASWVEREPLVLGHRLAEELRRLRGGS